MVKVTTIVLNGFTNDSRVLKENISLKKAGYDVKILALHKEGLKEFEIIEGLPVHRLSLKKNAEAIKAKKELKENSSSSTLDESILKEKNKKITEYIKNKNNMLSNIISEEEGENNAHKKHLINFESLKNKDIPLNEKFIIFVKIFVKYIRKLVRFFIRTLKKIYAFFKRLKRKILNKYFRLHKLKFNMLFVKEAKDSDIIHCNDLYTLPMGVIVKKFYNKDVKIVYDAHEYETEVNGLQGNKKRFRKIMEKVLIRYADKVICVSDAIANEYVRLYKIAKPSLVLNTPPFQNISKKDLFREKFHINQNQTIFLYQGGLSKGRGIEILLETFKKTDSNNVIVFMGYGPLEDLIIKVSKRYSNIYFHEAVSPNILLEYTSSADFGILFYENNCLNHYYCSPNKMFEYLMAGIPVIASNLYEMKRLVTNNNIGVVASDNTPDGLKLAIEKATLLNIEELQRNIQKVKEVYNWEEQEKILLSIYKDLTK